MNQHRLSWAVATAAAVVVAAWFTGAFVAARYEARLGQMARETAALRARLERDLAALNEQLAQYRSAADLLRDPATQVVALRGLGPSPEATGRVLWHPAIGGHLFVACRPRPRARPTRCGRSPTRRPGRRASSAWTPRDAGA